MKKWSIPWLYIQKYLFRTIDIGSPLCSELSNFHPYKFQFRGVEFTSMEALLQGIKFEIPKKQNEVFKLVGKKAKFKGKKSKWYHNQRLYFNDKSYHRRSIEYQNFIEEAFIALYTKNPEAKDNLLKTKGYRLIHSIGKNEESKTVLTEREFCYLLTKIRASLS